ncbi:MAG: acyl carrier protein [Blastocatellia bacterium]
MNNPTSTRIEPIGREELERRVVEIISVNLCIEGGDVRLGSSFQDLLARSFKDLGADSLDLYSIMMDLEDELGVQIPDREAQKFATVADAVEFIGDHALNPTLSTRGSRQHEIKRSA